MLKKSVRVLVVGGGVAGVRVAKDLLERHIGRLDLTLVSATSYLQYHAAFYRRLNSDNDPTVRIPLEDIFYKKKVLIVEDRIERIDFQTHTAYGKEKEYGYDHLVLAMGSEVAYYNIPGLRELAHTFKTYDDVVRLQNHLIKVFRTSRATDKNIASSTRFVVVGGGSTGAEVAGELAFLTRRLAREHGIDPSLVTIDLISATSRLTPLLPERVSHAVEERLRVLGVNVYLHHRLMKEEVAEVFLKDMVLRTKTVIWVAGTMGNHFYRRWGLPVSSSGQVEVEKTLAVKGYPSVFAGGDGAWVTDSGLVDSAGRHGECIAENITRSLKGVPLKKYRPASYTISIPVGRRWSASLVDGFLFTGAAGWFFRRYLDFKFYASVLPFFKAVRLLFV